jgi:hypothetical protein
MISSLGDKYIESLYPWLLGNILQSPSGNGMSCQIINLAEKVAGYT